MKETTKENIRIEIEPFISRYHVLTEKEALAECEDLKRQIARHVENSEMTSIRYDTMDRCSFCKRVWEVDEEGCPVCCQNAIDEWNDKV